MVIIQNLRHIRIRVLDEYLLDEGNIKLAKIYPGGPSLLLPNVHVTEYE